MRIPPPPVMLLLAALSLVLYAGASSAQVPDGSWVITDTKDSAATSKLSISGNTTAIEIQTTCVPFPPSGNSATGSAIRFNSTHPDGVKLKKNSGEVRQKEKTYQPVVRFITGSGNLRKTTIVQCKKVEVESKVATKKSPNTGSFEGKAKSCDCPPNVIASNQPGSCKDFADQVLQLSTDCLSHKSVKANFDTEKDEVPRLEIKGKGDAVPPAP